MENQEPKRTWVRPTLIILARSRPEEAVLVACKITGTPGSVLATFNGCTVEPNPGSCNTLCQLETVS